MPRNFNAYALNDWAVIHNPNADHYTPPELLTQHLMGFKHLDSTVIMDSKPIRETITSQVVGKQGDYVVTYSGSRVRLLDPKVTYEALFPNAKERFMRTLPELPADWEPRIGSRRAEPALESPPPVKDGGKGDPSGASRPSAWEED